MELAFGPFQLQPTASASITSISISIKRQRKRVFIATGTGSAPFLPIFKALEQKGKLDGSELLFGCRFGKGDITRSVTLGGSMPKATICISGEEVPVEGGGFYSGRVPGR